MSFTIKLKGMARVMLRDATSQSLVMDTGWTPNVVTDVGIIGFSASITLATGVSVFINESSAPGRTTRSVLPFVYSDQTVNQVRLPDTVDLDLAAATNTFTVQFPAPAVARNINTVGLTRTPGVNGGQVASIVAYSSLTTTVVQGTTQTADIQYRITWSFP